MCLQYHLQGKWYHLLNDLQFYIIMFKRMADEYVFLFCFWLFVENKKNRKFCVSYQPAVFSEFAVARRSLLWSAVCFLSSYLHSCSPPIIHGNLTCDTIFIQHNGLVKIGSGKKHRSDIHKIIFKVTAVFWCHCYDLIFVLSLCDSQPSVVDCYVSFRIQYFNWSSALLLSFCFQYICS